MSIEQVFSVFAPFAVILLGLVVLAVCEWFDRDSHPAWKTKLQLWLHRRRSAK